MDFDTALNLYLRNVENLQHRFMCNLISKETRDAVLLNNFYWFRSVLLFDHIEGYFKEVPVSELSNELRQKYDVTPDTFPLCSVIFYRDHEIPCYDDDYGQQVFAVYDEENWSGGTYNLQYGPDFCSMLDAKLEQELLDKIAAEHTNGE